MIIYLEINRIFVFLHEVINLESGCEELMALDCDLGQIQLYSKG